MPDSDSAPSERKIAALLLIAVVAGAIGIYSYGQEHPGTFDSFSSILKGISFPTGFSIFSGAKSQSLLIDAELTFDVPTTTKIEMGNPAESVLISFQNPGNTFTIDRMPWHYDAKTAIILKNYTGSMELSSLLSLSGSAKSISVNSATIPASDKGISVSASSFGFDSVIIGHADGIGLELKNITGTITANDGKNSATYNVSNNTLSVSSFTGDIEYYGRRIVLRGSGKIDTELLGAKSG